MTTPFLLLSKFCGLTIDQSAEFFGVTVDAIKSWRSGRNQAPEGVLDELYVLAAKLETTANQTIHQIDKMVSEKGGIPELIEIGLSTDNYEAQSLGCPSVGVHERLIALVIAKGHLKGYNFKIVPRGSTVGTAAACDAHNK